MIPFMVISAWAIGWMATSYMLLSDWWNGVDWWHNCTKSGCQCVYCKQQRDYDRRCGYIRGESPAVDPLSYENTFFFVLLCLVAWPILFLIEVQTRAKAAQARHMEYLKRKGRPIEEVLGELNEMLRKEGADELSLPCQGRTIIRSEVRE